MDTMRLVYLNEQRGDAPVVAGRSARATDSGTVAPPTDNYCGSTSDHCGNGCQGGLCLTGGETTDGTCGAGYNDVICGVWPQGSCRSSAGYCGSSEAHCGPGCQSGPCLQDPDGKGSGDIYIDNTVYVQHQAKPYSHYSERNNHHT